MPSLRALSLSLLTAALCAQGERTQSERPPEEFQLAIGLLQRGLFDEAAVKFTAFLEQQPKHALVPEAFYRRGLCQIESKRPKEAIADLQQALARGGTSFRLLAECRYRLAGLFEQAGQHGPAAEQFGLLATSVPADHYLLAAARFGEGEAWREAKDDGKAAAAFAAAVTAATGERANYKFPALYQLGFAQLRQQDLAAAVTTFAAAAEAAADDAGRGECWYLSGDARLRQRDFDGAEAAFRRALAVRGEFADDAAYGLGFVQSGRGDAKAAAAAFAAVVSEHAQSPLAASARLEWARALYQDQRAADAQRELQPLLTAGGPEALQQQARELAGLCALATGAGAGAVAALREALQGAAPAERPRLSFALGEALANLQRYDEALAAYDSVPDEAPAELRGDARYGASFVLHALGRHAESQQRAEAVLQLAPPHRLAAEARLAVAENQFAQQQYEAAEAGYAVLVEGPHAAVAAWKLAWCRYLRGDHREAAKRFAAIAAGKSAEAEEALAMAALAALEAGAADEALQTADRYRARYRDGAFVDRTERVAAKVLQQRGELAAAQQRLANAARISKQRGAEAEALTDTVEQAELSYRSGDYQAAAALFTGLAEREDAIGARARMGLCWCAFELGDEAVCAERLTAAKAHPAFAAERAGWLELSSALHHRTKDWPAAIADAQQFLADFATSPKALAMRYALGVAQARSGDATAARTTLAALAQVADAPRPDRVQYELAWACRHGGAEAEALAAFAACAAATEDAELRGECQLHLGTAALSRQDLAAARPLLEAVTGGHQPAARYRLAFAEFEAAGADPKLLAVARDRFLQVAAVPGELSGEARYLAGECCHRLGDDRAAVAHLQQLLQQEPTHARAVLARLRLGESALRLGDAAAVVAALEPLRSAERGANALERADQARVHLWLGRARLLQQDHAAAEALLAKVLELSDGALAAEAQFRIGESRLARGALNAAAEAFVALPILYAEPEWVRRGLLEAGRTYQLLQQPDKAQRFWRELIERHPDTAEAKAAAELLPKN
ncbi:MAG: tetratricopeptide repeat protein [Planctomycetes bacterium]|jgi:tetratricopeptide (TPR) repeat protein|nr:tetratricopeptide repeat protein [Planctomycetota bacterium]